MRANHQIYEKSQREVRPERSSSPGRATLACPVCDRMVCNCLCMCWRHRHDRRHRLGIVIAEELEQLARECSYRGRPLQRICAHEETAA